MWDFGMLQYTLKVWYEIPKNSIPYLRLKGFLTVLGKYRQNAPELEVLCGIFDFPEK